MNKKQLLMIISVLLFLNFFLIFDLYWKSISNFLKIDQKLANIFGNENYLYLKWLTNCPSWQRVSEFKDLISWNIVVTKCEKNNECTTWNKLQIFCWIDGDNTSCIYSCQSDPDNIWNIKPVIWRWVGWWLYKPVIYLYPQTPTDVKVELKLAWKIIADYPKYDYSLSGWYVKANPDWNIFNYADNKNYNYLFWEWELTQNHNWNLDKWFVVKGENIRDFLENILPKIWLSDKESDDFITYWYPKLQTNKYNLIHFSAKEYTDLAPLKTTPNYDSILRVFMVTKALDKPIEIQKQDFSKFERKWFSVVEWWWTIVK